MAKDDDTRRKWNQTHHFPTQNNRPILGSYWFYLFKKIHFRRKLHLSDNMKEEMRSVWGHAYMPSLCNILLFSFYRSFLWALIKGNGIKVFFLPLSNVLLTLNTVTQIAGGWDLPTEEELHFPLLPGCDWNTWLVPCWACHLLLLWGSRWPKGIARAVRWRRSKSSQSHIFPSPLRIHLSEVA